MPNCYAYDATGWRTPIALKKDMSFGGEGTIFETDQDGLIAKIFEPGHDTKNKYDKCRYLLESADRLRTVRASWPTHLLFDAEGCFLGYLMPKMRGVPLANLINRVILVEDYPNARRAHLVKLCELIAANLGALHAQDILMCDINMQNILVDQFGGNVNAQQVSFIDCDSYQIGIGRQARYLGEVGHPGFTPPELQGLDLSQVSRTLEHERFSVAVLMFMILMAGQSPYAMVDGSSAQEEGVKAGDFPYKKLGTYDTGKIPNEWSAGIWTHTWTSVSMGLWDCLHREGSYYAPQERPETTYWAAVMTIYGKLLDGAARNNPESADLKLFPKLGSPTVLGMKNSLKQRTNTKPADKHVQESSHANKTHNSRLARMARWVPFIGSRGAH